MLWSSAVARNSSLSFPHPMDHPQQAFMDVEAELDEWTGLI